MPSNVVPFSPSPPRGPFLTVLPGSFDGSGRAEARGEAGPLSPSTSTAGHHMLSSGGALGRPVITARRREYSFGDMVRLLALSQLEPRTQVDHLRLLAKQSGLPLPMNPRKFRGRIQTGACAIGRKSLWCALSIDAWLDDRGPPPGTFGKSVAGALVDTPAIPAPVRAQMRDRARQLAAGGGR